jgi:hypothetical protein
VVVHADGGQTGGACVEAVPSKTPPVFDSNLRRIALVETCFCDICLQPIVLRECGVIIWFKRGAGSEILGRDLRIVHHLFSSPHGENVGCYPNESDQRLRDGSSMSLVPIAGALEHDTMMHRFMLIELERIPCAEVNRFIKRLFVPKYEEARRYFEVAYERGVVDQYPGDDFFTQNELSRIVENIPILEPYM